MLNREYKDILSKWSKSVEKAYLEEKEQSNGKERIVVAIARKGPRLCELKNVHGHIISEHAIPFSYPELINSPVILMDEAIYFGTTFRRIGAILATGRKLYAKAKGQNIRTLEEFKTNAAPVVMSNKAYSLLENKFNWEGFYTLIDDKDIPNYINYLINDFYKLGKPFDVEFPIIYMDIPKAMEDKSDDEFAKFLESVFANICLGRGYTYILKHKVQDTTYYNVTRLLSDSVYQNTQKVHSDFEKIRTFWNRKTGKLAITFYSPHILKDDYLTMDSPLFKDTPYEEIWHSLWNRISEFKVDFIPISKIINQENKSDMDEEYMNKEFNYHIHRSLIIWANYIYSFQMALELMDYIKKSLFTIDIGAATTTLNVKDLMYLAGPELAPTIKERLERMLVEKIVPQLPEITIGDLHIDNYIPEVYKTKYTNKITENKNISKNTSEMISQIFFNMHFNVELAGRSNPNENLSRLRFGETFTSLFNKGFTENYKDLLLNTHKAVDFRIDNGSIVPKYLCNDKDQKAWVRVFRCGENEDLYAQWLIRLAGMILDSLASVYENDLLPEVLIRAAFDLSLCQDKNVKNVFEGVWMPWEFSYCKSQDCPGENIHIAFTNELGIKRDLFDYCKDQKLICATDIPGFISYNNTILPEASLELWQIKNEKEDIDKVALRLNLLNRTLVEMYNEQFPLIDITEWIVFNQQMLDESYNRFLKWCDKYKSLPKNFHWEDKAVIDFNNSLIILPKCEDILKERFSKHLAPDLEKAGLIRPNIADYVVDKVDELLDNTDFIQKRNNVYGVATLLACYLYISQNEYKDRLEKRAKTLKQYFEEMYSCIKSAIDSEDLNKLNLYYSQIITHLLKR